MPFAATFHRPEETMRIPFIALSLLLPTTTSSLGQWAALRVYPAQKQD